jgi:hypothetical protein
MKKSKLKIKIEGRGKILASNSRRTEEADEMLETK